MGYIYPPLAIYRVGFPWYCGCEMEMEMGCVNCGDWSGEIRGVKGEKGQEGVK